MLILLKSRTIAIVGSLEESLEVRLEALQGQDACEASVDEKVPEIVTKLTFPCDDADRFKMEILRQQELPSDNSLLLLCVGDILSSNSFYAQFVRTQLRLAEYQIFMNRDDVVGLYKKLSSKLKVGDIVMALREEFWQRGLVKEVFDDVCIVS